MIKNKEKANALIKRSNLVLEMKKQGIRRTSKDSILLLEKYLNDFLQDMLKMLKQEIIINGRKTLKKEDISNVLKKIKEAGEYWEI